MRGHQAGRGSRTRRAVAHVRGLADPLAQLAHLERSVFVDEPWVTRRGPLIGLGLVGAVAVWVMWAIDTFAPVGLAADTRAVRLVLGAIMVGVSAVAWARQSQRVLSVCLSVFAASLSLSIALSPDRAHSLYAVAPLGLVLAVTVTYSLSSLEVVSNLVATAMATAILAARTGLSGEPATYETLLLATALVIGMTMRHHRLGGLMAVYRLRAQLEDLARQDQLTEVLNRHGWWSAATDRMDAIRASGQGKAAVAFLDIDRFKEINDRHGHVTGDEVIRQVANHLRHHVRDGDVLARFGGEEFVVLLTVGDTTEAVAAVERLLGGASPRDGSSFPITLSAGLAVDEEGDPDLDRLIDGADRAMLAAKAAGRDQLVVWTGEPGAKHPARRVS